MTNEAIVKFIATTLEEAKAQMDQLEAKLKPDDYAIRKDVADYHRIEERIVILSVLKGMIEK